jgi:hypothetical protein
MRLLLVSFATLAGLALAAPMAGAVIMPAVTIEGPSPEIVGFGGVAMAEDGTGGAVFLKRVDGVAHVFVSRYVEDHWLPPIRVDGEQPFAASSPVIGAADGGELLVVWATPFASENEQPVDRLMSATLAPGATGFGPAQIVDRDIGRGQEVSPDLAMSSNGQADVVYRVVTSSEGEPAAIPLLRPGDVAEEVRVAHFRGEQWSRVGAVNRDLGLSMRPPTAANAPQIAIGSSGNGIVVWQEPEISGVARIWARRLFGATADYAMLVSATGFAGAPIDEDADAPAVAYSGDGQAEVAYRQDAGAGSPLPGPRILVNTLPSGESASGAQFSGPTIVDQSVPGGHTASIGRPSIDIDKKGLMRLLYDSDGTPHVVQGTDLGLLSTLPLGPPFVGSALAKATELTPVSVIDPQGGGVSAWPSADPHGNPAVAVREDFPEGAVQTALVSGAGGGPIGQLAVGRSGMGDGLVAFEQGPVGDAAIVAATVSAPPEKFVLAAPRGWIKRTQAQISWEQSESANGPVTYTVVLDGHRLATPAGALEYSIDPGALSEGVHQVQVLATDVYGQSTLTAPSPLRIDDHPPAVTVTGTRAGLVKVHVSDAQAPLDLATVRVSFGDGQLASGRARFSHRYARPGRYTLVVRASDTIGNSGMVRRVVTVR